MNKENLKLILLTFVIITKTLNAQEYELEEMLDIPYRNGALAESQEARLNLVIPKSVENPPVLMWIGQGAWAYVNRNVEMNLCRQIAKKGIVVVSTGHRLSPALLWEPHRQTGIQHPEHIKDIAAAVHWLTQNAEKYGFTTDRLFVGGYSSGAHLCTLLVSDERYLKEYDLTKDMIKGIIPVAGGYDIPAYREAMVALDPAYDEKHIIPVFGDSESQKDASPSTYLEHFTTPALLISERDTYDYTKTFEEMLIQDEKENVIIIHARNRNHSDLWKELGNEEPSYYRDLMVGFMKSAGSF